MAADAVPMLRELPVDRWDDMFDQHPRWRRFGTFEALLDEAKEELHKRPPRAQAMVDVVIRQSEGLEVPDGAELLKPLLEGLTLKVCASAQNVQGQHDAAFENIERSLLAFSGSPALEVERAAALLVRAQIQHARKQIADALTTIAEAVRVFEAHYQYKRLEMALEICGHILLDQKSYAAAREVYQTAYGTAERLNDEDALLRINNALGLCAVYLRQPEEASFRLTLALAGVKQRGMHGAMQSIILNLARAARDRGELDTALESMHVVYAEFVDRKMPEAAAEVLVELGDTVTELTQDVAYARDVCRRLAETMVASEGVPVNLRDALKYLRHATEKPSSVSVVREAFNKVRIFLNNPTAAFVV